VGDSGTAVGHDAGLQKFSQMIGGGAGTVKLSGPESAIVAALVK
jgi:hypothetical protein